jgi:predicted site-specific integrase-resolvase
MKMVKYRAKLSKLDLTITKSTCQADSANVVKLQDKRVKGADLVIRFH